MGSTLPNFDRLGCIGCALFEVPRFPDNAVAQSSVLQYQFWHCVSILPCSVHFPVHSILSLHRLGVTAGTTVTTLCPPYLLFLGPLMQMTRQSRDHSRHGEENSSRT